MENISIAKCFGEELLASFFYSIEKITYEFTSLKIELMHPRSNSHVSIWYVNKHEVREVGEL